MVNNHKIEDVQIYYLNNVDRLMSINRAHGIHTRGLGILLFLGAKDT